MSTARRKMLALVVVMLLPAASGCDDKEMKKKEAERMAVQTGPQGAVDRALGASGNSAPIQAGKGAMVAQQCALRCQAQLGIDPGSCLARCTKACDAEKDVAGIDACALRTADQSPKL